MTKNAVLIDALPGLFKSITEAFESLGLASHEAVKNMRDFNEAYAAISKLDGRKTAWTEERKAKHADKVRAAAAVKNAGKLWIWQWSDVPPKEFASLADAAEYMKSTVNSLKVLRSQSGGLGVIRKKDKRQIMVLASSEEDMKKLLRLKYTKTGSFDDILELPTKNMKNY